MTTHHLKAHDLIVTREWRSMDTFPQDGSIVEVTDASGFICKAQWHSERVLPASLKLDTPTAWRELTE